MRPEYHESRPQIEAVRTEINQQNNRRQQEYLKPKARPESYNVEVSIRFYPNREYFIIRNMRHRLESFQRPWNLLSKNL